MAAGPLPRVVIARKIGRAYSDLAVRQTLPRQSTWNIPDVRTLATTLLFRFLGLEEYLAAILSAIAIRGAMPDRGLSAQHASPG
jgi:hypothetical protein